MFGSTERLKQICHVVMTRGGTGGRGQREKSCWRGMAKHDTGK